MTLSVQAQGPDDGEPIVLLHAFGLASWMWADQVEALSAEYLCLSVDLPGHGASRDTSWVHLAHAAEAVMDAVRHRTQRPVHIVGLSLGAYVGWHLLRTADTQVASAVLSGITLRPLTPTWLATAVARWGSPLLTSGPAARLAARAMHLPPEAAAAYRAELAGIPTATARQVYAQVYGFDPEPLTPSSRVLVVAGGAEVGAVTDSLTRAPELIRGARTAHAPGLHHGWNGEDPDLFSETVAAWVAGRDLPDALVPGSTA